MACGHLLSKTGPVRLCIWNIGYENPSQGGVQSKAWSRQDGEDREPVEWGSCWSVFHTGKMVGGGGTVVLNSDE